MPPCQWHPGFGTIEHPGCHWNGGILGNGGEVRCRTARAAACRGTAACPRPPGQSECGDGPDRLPAVVGADLHLRGGMESWRVPDRPPMGLGSRDLEVDAIRLP